MNQFLSLLEKAVKRGGPTGTLKGWYEVRREENSRMEVKKVSVMRKKKE